MKDSRHRLVVAWWNEPPSDWLVDFLDSRGVLCYLKYAVATVSAAFAAILILALVSPAGPHDSSTRWAAVVVAVLAGGRSLWWLFAPWPGRRLSALSIAIADVVIALACWLIPAPLLGLAATTIFQLPGAYLTFFHGAKAQVAHIGWATMVIVGLAVDSAADPGRGGWAAAAAQALLCLLVTVGILPVLQIGFWTVRESAADSLLDPLTALANRRGLDYQLNRFPARSSRGSMCVFAIDLDRFKALNDRYGHLAGDRVLVQAAAGIRENMCANAVVARIGGEEFVAIGLIERPAVQETAERIRDAIGSIDPPVTASIGVAVTTAHELPRSQDVGKAMECADGAMYRAKRQGGNAIAIHSCTVYGELAHRSRHCDPVRPSVVIDAARSSSPSDTGAPEARGSWKVAMPDATW